MIKAKKFVRISKKFYSILCKDVQIKCNINPKGSIQVEEKLQLQGTKGEIFEKEIPRQNIETVSLQTISKQQDNELKPFVQSVEELKDENEFLTKEDSNGLHIQWKMQQDGIEDYILKYDINNILTRENLEKIILQWRISSDDLKYDIENLKVIFDGPDLYEVNEMSYTIRKNLHVIKKESIDVTEMKEISFSITEPILQNHEIIIDMKIKIDDINEIYEKKKGNIIMIIVGLFIFITFYFFHETSRIPKNYKLDEAFDQLSYGGVNMLINSLNSKEPEKIIISLLLGLNQKGHIKFLKTDDSRIQIYRTESNIPLYDDEKNILNALFQRDPKKSFVSLEWNNLNADALMIQVGRDLFQKGYYENKNLLRNIVTFFGIGSSLSFFFVKNPRISYSLIALGIFTLFETKENPLLSNLSKKGNESRKNLLGYKKYVESMKDRTFFDSNGNIQTFDQQAKESIVFNVFQDYNDKKYINRLEIELMTNPKISPYLQLPFTFESEKNK